jgi:hypothetical protein
MDCKAICEQLSAYLDGELDEASTARVEEHLAACETCRDGLASLRDLTDILHELPREEAPATVERDVVSYIERDALLRPRPNTRRTRRRRPLLYRSAALAAALLVAVVGITALMGSGEGEAPPDDLVRAGNDYDYAAKGGEVRRSPWGDTGSATRGNSVSTSTAPTQAIDTTVPHEGYVAVDMPFRLREGLPAISGISGVEELVLVAGDVKKTRTQVESLAGSLGIDTVKIKMTDGRGADQHTSDVDLFSDVSLGSLVRRSTGQEEFMPLTPLKRPTPLKPTSEEIMLAVYPEELPELVAMLREIQDSPPRDEAADIRYQTLSKSAHEIDVGETVFRGPVMRDMIIRRDDKLVSLEPADSVQKQVKVDREAGDMVLLRVVVEHPSEAIPPHAVRTREVPQR